MPRCPALSSSWHLRRIFRLFSSFFHDQPSLVESSISFFLKFRYFNRQIVSFLLDLLQRYDLQKDCSILKWLFILFPLYEYISHSIFFSFLIFKLERYVLHFQCPSCLSLIDDAGFPEISQILVICNDLFVFFQIFPSFFDRLNYCQHFLLSYDVILFCWVHFS